VPEASHREGKKDQNQAAMHGRAPQQHENLIAEENCIVDAGITRPVCGLGLYWRPDNFRNASTDLAQPCRPV